MILETDRLILRRFAAADADGLRDHIGREEGQRFERAWAASRQACVAADERFSNGEEFTAAELKATGRLVGLVVLARVPAPFVDSWELGYVFHPDHQGKGLAFEACAALIGRVFLQQRGHRVVARCARSSMRSWRLLERLGFRREGHAIKAVSFETDAGVSPVWSDEYQYAILAHEWTDPTTGAASRSGMKTASMHAAPLPADVWEEFRRRP